MMRSQITRCPSCQAAVEVTELTCSTCGLQMRGRFERGCRFCVLDPGQRHLLEVFLSCRGVVREMEKVLGVSYPTVRSRVDALLAALGYSPKEAESREELAARRTEVLDKLEAGEMTAEEAAKALKELGD